MSQDGGQEKEFEAYWEYWRQPRLYDGGWAEGRVHPQLAANVPTPYWYHPATYVTVYTRPDQVQGPGLPALLEDPPALEGEGPAWELSVEDLKAMLQGQLEQRQNLGLTSEELAKRAVHEYEKWMPRVLSWHDHQHRTFWYFGEKDELPNSTGVGADNKNFFDRGSSRELFADDEFFRAVARLAVKRLLHIHPINITYLVWTFARASVLDQELMDAVGDHFCDGLLPTLDRCSLGTIIWCYWKLNAPHKRLFQEVAVELSRPVRLRSLAPRNFQNSMIAFSRMNIRDADFIDAMARGIPRLLRNHDPRSSKCERSLLFSYTCRSGDEVPADSFRIRGLCVIARAFDELGASGQEVERCFEAMTDYVLRSLDRSPPMMREPGDAALFALTLARAEEGLPKIQALLDRLLDRLPDVCQGAPERTVVQLWEALRRAGMDAPT